MLEHVPAWLGKLFKDFRAGHEKLATSEPELAGVDTAIDLSSPAFAAGARLPIRFTADGEGISPPLVWGPLPAGTTSLALIVEDPDAPTPSPLIHTLLWNLPPDRQRIAEGEMMTDHGTDEDEAGHANPVAHGWVPPDPPTGHGEHDYVFQLFALRRAPYIGATPSRADIVKAMDGIVLGMGVLVGTYSRGEELPVGPAAQGLAGDMSAVGP